MRVPERPACDQPEEARELKVRHHDHHAEQQDDRIEINRADRLPPA